MEVKYNPPPEIQGTVDVSGIPMSNWCFVVGVLDNLDHPLINEVTSNIGMLPSLNWAYSHQEGARFIRKIRGDGK